MPYKFSYFQTAGLITASSIKASSTRPAMLSRLPLFLLPLILPLITRSTASTLPANRRGQLVCFNDGKTKAGDLLPRRSIPLDSDTSALTPRVDPPIPIPCIWCALGSPVFLRINSLVPTDRGLPDLQAAQTRLLSEALNTITTAISQHGNVPVPGGVFHMADFGFRWYSRNFNNHQQTWETLREAVAALLSFYMRNEAWGAVTFWVYDRLHPVAEGVFEPR